jgi:hypothetical protein
LVLRLWRRRASATLSASGGTYVTPLYAQRWNSAHSRASASAALAPHLARARPAPKQLATTRDDATRDDATRDERASAVGGVGGELAGE